MKLQLRLFLARDIINDRLLHTVSVFHCALPILHVLRFLKSHVDRPYRRELCLYPLPPVLWFHTLGPSLCSCQDSRYDYIDLRSYGLRITDVNLLLRTYLFQIPHSSIIIDRSKVEIPVGVLYFLGCDSYVIQGLSCGRMTEHLLKQE